MLHADDLIRLYQAAYEARLSISGEIFNIGGGLANSLSLLELFSHLADKLKMPSLSYVNTPHREEPVIRISLLRTSAKLRGSLAGSLKFL